MPCTKEGKGRSQIGDNIITAVSEQPVCLGKYFDDTFRGSRKAGDTDKQLDTWINTTHKRNTKPGSANTGYNHESYVWRANDHGLDNGAAGQWLLDEMACTFPQCWVIQSTPTDIDHGRIQGPRGDTTPGIRDARVVQG
jgi:hypothetical protein